MRTTDEHLQTTELVIGGMTCASCAARIEKKLNRLDGVTATVNYATEKAQVSYTDGVTPDDLIATVEKTGYTAALPAPEPAIEESDGLSRRLAVSATLSVPVVLLGMISALHFPGWQWVSLVLASACALLPAGAASAASGVVGHVYVNDNTREVNTVGVFDRHADGTLTAMRGSPGTRRSSLPPSGWASRYRVRSGTRTGSPSRGIPYR